MAGGNPTIGAIAKGLGMALQFCFNFYILMITYGVGNGAYGAAGNIVLCMLYKSAGAG